MIQDHLLSIMAYNIGVFCAICAEGFDQDLEGDVIRAIDCPDDHFVHKDCGLDYFIERRSCPVCNQPSLHFIDLTGNVFNVDILMHDHPQVAPHGEYYEETTVVHTTKKYYSGSANNCNEYVEEGEDDSEEESDSEEEELEEDDEEETHAGNPSSYLYVNYNI